MRLFRYVFGGLGLVFILGMVGWWVWDRAVLAIASYQLRMELVDLRKIAHQGILWNSCSSGFGGYQLRFINETEYVIEPVCDEPGVEGFKMAKLFGGVKRLYGSGVMIKLVDGVPVIKDAWVHLVYNDNQVVVGLFGGVAKVVWNPGEYEFGGESPAEARCSDWGFTCCQSGIEIGNFSKVRTYDCANNCYQHCDRLPLILYFNTIPVMNSKTREVVVQKSDPIVSFGYEVSDDEQGLELEIDFGDGIISNDLPLKSTNLQHKYQCGETVCLYQVVMTAKDVGGNSLADSGLDKVFIIVR